MTDGVRQEQRIGELATERDGLRVARESLEVAAHVAFDLSKTLERIHELTTVGRASTERDGLDQVAMRIGEARFSASAIGLAHQRFDSL